jgi:hypothetical protein
MPKIAAIVVIMIGRKRSTAASRIASSADLASCRRPRREAKSRFISIFSCGLGRFEVARDILQAEDRLKLVVDLRRPLLQFGEVDVLQRVSVLGAADSGRVKRQTRNA